MTRDELKTILYETVKADIECEADATNEFQKGYSVGFNDCRARALDAIASALAE